MSLSCLALIYEGAQYRMCILTHHAVVEYKGKNRQYNHQWQFLKINHLEKFLILTALVDSLA